MEVDFSEQIKDFIRNSKRSSSVSLSESVSSLLEFKTNTHNEINEDKISCEQLKKVFRRGSAVYAHSHLVNKTRGQLALARVNNFIKMVRGEEVNEAYKLADKDIKDGQETYYIESPSKAFVSFTDLELDLACLELIKAGIEKWDQDIECSELEYTKQEKETINKPFKMSNDEFGVFVKNPENGRTSLVKFEKRRVRASLIKDVDVLDSLYWSAKFWTKKPISESISSDAVEWDDKEIVTQWYWDESSFLEYEDIFKLDPKLDDFIGSISCHS